MICLQISIFDLKELEKMVDEALAKETKESWNKWLEEESMTTKHANIDGAAYNELRNLDD